MPKPKSSMVKRGKHAHREMVQDVAEATSEDAAMVETDDDTDDGTDDEMGSDGMETEYEEMEDHWKQLEYLIKERAEMLVRLMDCEREIKEKGAILDCYVASREVASECVLASEDEEDHGFTAYLDARRQATILEPQADQSEAGSVFEPCTMSNHPEEQVLLQKYIGIIEKFHAERNDLPHFAGPEDEEVVHECGLAIGKYRRMKELEGWHANGLFGLELYRLHGTNMKYIENEEEAVARRDQSVCNQKLKLQEACTELEKRGVVIPLKYRV